ncbi:MAG: hypothetical protein K0U63_12465 [Cyanobacteria bacterium]|nr:hypothetical protein [Cyanobacteriota bacterium]
MTPLPPVPPLFLPCPAPSSVRCSDSLMAGLCREVDRARQRGGQLLALLARCQDRGLGLRLRQELVRLQERRRELLATALSWQESDRADPLALEFLIELCSRPLPG